MSHNTFGHLFRVTTFGESHGVALGCVVDGCPLRGLAHVRRRTSRRSSTGASPDSRASPLSGASPIRSGFSPASSPTIARVASSLPPARRSPWRSRTPTSARRITPRSATATGRAMPITPTTPSTASAITAAADGPRPARPPRESPPVPSRRKVLPDRRHHPRRPGADGTPRHRPVALGLGSGERATRSSAPMPETATFYEAIPRRHPQGRLVGGCGDRGGGRGRAPRASVRRSTASSTRISPPR